MQSTCTEKWPTPLSKLRMSNSWLSICNQEFWPAYGVWFTPRVFRGSDDFRFTLHYRKVGPWRVGTYETGGSENLGVPGWVSEKCYPHTRSSHGARQTLSHNSIQIASPPKMGIEVKQQELTRNNFSLGVLPESVESEAKCRESCWIGS